MTRALLLAVALVPGLAATLTSAPAWAQANTETNSTQTNSTAANSSAANAPAQPAAGGGTTLGTATISPTNIPPSERNPLLTDSGEVRIGEMIGSNIYNKADEKIGSVSDVLAGANGQLQVVVSTNDKRVAVPWDKVQFGDAKLNSHNKVLMLDETQKSLDSLPPFKPTKGKG